MSLSVFRDSSDLTSVISLSLETGNCEKLPSATTVGAGHMAGAQTAEAARELSLMFDTKGVDVYCSHLDRRVAIDDGSHVKSGEIISWMGTEFKASSRLAFPDIAVIDRVSKKIILLAEVEESKAQPKLVIADLFATLLGDHITFGRNHKEDLKLGSWTTYIVLAKSSGRGSGEQQLKILASRLDEVRKHLTTSNAALGKIIIETYRDESDLTRKLVAHTQKALRESKAS
jgi:hypothetical protein